MVDMREVLDDGHVLLVNTGGNDHASEIAGDLLGKLVMRAVIYAAKRRRTGGLALVLADGRLQNCASIGCRFAPRVKHSRCWASPVIRFVKRSRKFPPQKYVSASTA
jgi:hypothetical protein